MSLRDKVLRDQQADALQNSYKEELKVYSERVKQEEARVASMTCPCCKSTEKIHNVDSENNGVLGPGYSVNILADYYICKSCGVHYSDLNKAELVYPELPFLL